MLRKIKIKLCNKKKEFCVFFNDMDNDREKLFDFAEIFLAILGKKAFCWIRNPCFYFNYLGYNIFNPLWLSTNMRKLYAAYFTLIVPFLSYVIIASVYNVRDDIELEFSALGGMFANIQVNFQFVAKVVKSLIICIY